MARVVRHPVKVRVITNYVLKRLLGLIPHAVDCGGVGVLFVHFVARRPGAADSRTRSRRAGDRAGFVSSWGLTSRFMSVLALHLTHVLQGDFGTSMVSRRPVLRIVAAFADAVADDKPV